MTELTRKVEVKDIINALASVSIPLDVITRQGKLTPTELYRIIEVMQGLLVLHTLLNVQKFSTEPSFSKAAADEMFELATGVIDHARRLLISGPAANQVDELLAAYSEAVEAGFSVIATQDHNLERNYRLALRWTTP
jgi:hypothetical protein